LVGSSRDELIDRAAYYGERARSLLTARLENAELRLLGVQRRAPLAHPLWMVERRQQHLDDLQARMFRARHTCLQQWQHRLALAAGKLEGLSPIATLARGYAIVTRLPDESAFTSVEQTAKGETIRVRLADGVVDAEVKQLSRSSQDEQHP
jgi:exodeoxyribonuclease VII large subunit